MPTILVIDDDKITRRLIVKSLNRDFTILEAQDGVSGVQMALQNKPELVICDIHMPDIDGYAVLESLRDNEATANTSFIFLSGLTDPTEIRYGMNLGADDYLTKPFSINELRQAVDARLKKKALQEAVLKKTIEELRQNLTMSLPHELRTAVMVLEGYIYLMFEDANESDPERQNILKGMSAYTERLHQLSEKFLWYSRIQLLRPEKQGACKRPLEIIQYLCTEKAAQTQRIPDLVVQLVNAEVNITDEYLGRIVEEVVENAFKFSEAGKPVSVRSAVNGDWYEITITDKGHGMTEEHINKIGAFMQFEREFYEQKGTGLGLVIAKRLAELCGGQFIIKSIHKEQTAVTINLPILKPVVIPQLPSGHAEAIIEPPKRATADSLPVTKPLVDPAPEVATVPAPKAKPKKTAPLPST